jgi:hypothetical protein
MDSMQRCGASFRAVRIKRGWRQIDVAMRAHLDRSVVEPGVASGEEAVEMPALDRRGRARLAAHRTVLRTAFPVDGRVMAGWLRQPDRSMDALSLWDRPDAKSGVADMAARHRVRASRLNPARPS